MNAPRNFLPTKNSTKTPLAVKVADVSRIFDGRTVLDSLSLDIRPGEFVALLGASGSGKTTLLRILAGLDAPDAGEAWVPEARTVVYQEPRLVLSRRVWRNVVVGLSGPQATRDQAVKALAEVGLRERADAWPATLSGGEAQRAALARALVREPRLLLLDEPFAALDALTRLKMQRLIRDLCQVHGPATLLVTHDVEEAILLADRILVLREGAIAFDAQVSIPHPREAEGQRFDALRAQLLGELGVSVAARAAPNITPIAPRHGAVLLAN
jgi:sulfonate transport system ATP-binding protein